MKKLSVLAIALLVTSNFIFAQKAGRVDTTKHLTLYSCSMHPEVMAHKAGKCSKCGMELGQSAKEQMKAREMKAYKCPVHLDVTKHDPGKCPKCGKKLHLSPKEQMKAEVVKLYTCPMHPEVALDKKGNCSKCGKALVEKKDNN